MAKQEKKYNASLYMGVSKIMKEKLSIQKQVYDISDLSVAESLMILNPTWSKREDLLKYALMDLLVRGVLEIKREILVRKVDGRKPKSYLIIKSNKNIDSHVPKIHEKYILNHFQKKSSKYLIRNFLKQLYTETKRLDKVKTLVSKTLISNGYIPKYNIGGCWSAFQLTKSGKNKQSQIKCTLKYIDSNLSEISKNPELLKLILSKLGTNFILLKNINLEISTAINQTISTFGLQQGESFDSDDYFLIYDSMFDYDFTFDNLNFDFGGSDGADFGE